MSISRREFLKIIGASTIIAASPAFSSQRKPYVNKQSYPVDYIGVNGNGFLGSKIVEDVLDFDGVGYPVLLKPHSSNGISELYYDFDLVDMVSELPNNFWWSEHNKNKYPNVHTYFREQRFGESVHEAIFHMRNGQSLPKNWEQFISKT